MPRKRLGFKAIVGLLIAAGLLMVLFNAGSAIALSELSARPILAFVGEDGAVRVPVQTPGQPAKEAEARPLGGTGIFFGYSLSYTLPDGGPVRCTIRFRSLSCDDGWVAERAPAQG